MIKNVGYFVFMIFLGNERNERKYDLKCRKFVKDLFFF